MHPEADALLDAIWDNPDDDTPRLVYADWLQEHDFETYAEFIRVSVLIARQVLPQEERSRLRRQRYLLGRELIKAHPFVTEVVMGTVPPLGIPEYQFSTDAEGLLQNWREWWPFVAPRSLSLRHLLGREAEVANREYLDRLVALTCSGYLSGPVFYEHRHEVHWSPIKGTLITALYLRAGLDRLRALKLEPVLATAQDLLAFSESPLVARLEELHLWVQFPDGTREDLRGNAGYVSEHICEFVAQHGARFGGQWV